MFKRPGSRGQTQMSVKGAGLPRCAHVGVWVPRVETGRGSGWKLGLRAFITGRRGQDNVAKV